MCTQSKRPLGPAMARSRPNEASAAARICGAARSPSCSLARKAKCSASDSKRKKRRKARPSRSSGSFAYGCSHWRSCASDAPRCDSDARTVTSCIEGADGTHHDNARLSLSPLSLPLSLSLCVCVCVRARACVESQANPHGARPGGWARACSPRSASGGHVDSTRPRDSIFALSEHSPHSCSPSCSWIQCTRRGGSGGHAIALGKAWATRDAASTLKRFRSASSSKK
mmetsp:Transcript_29010/g.91886  ORF Transcript_29010/g.91886 Transcript_29010/m.91886 type:complete len:227 (-) Transcript_29010:163-843(-)